MVHPMQVSLRTQTYFRLSLVTRAEKTGCPRRLIPSRGSSSTVSRSNWNLEVLVFVEGGKPENPEKNPRSKARTKNKLNPLMTSSPAFEPRPHWWEASALTTALSLLSPVRTMTKFKLFGYVCCIERPFNNFELQPVTFSPLKNSTMLLIIICLRSPARVYGVNLIKI